MLLLISVLILVHEAGHFFAARIFGIKVDRVGFGLPIGPTLFEKKIGDITYCIHAFLMGGYVGFPDDNPESEIPKDDPDRISNRPAWQKIIVISAGVTANVIIAYLLVMSVAFFAGELPSGQYKILAGETVANSAARQTGIQKGDQIISVNGIDVTNPMIFIETIRRSKPADGFVQQQDIEAQVKNIMKANPEITNENAPLTLGMEIKVPKARSEAPVMLPQDFYLRTQKKPDGIALSHKHKDLRDEIAQTDKIYANGEYSVYDIALASADTFHPIKITVKRDKRLVKLKEVYPNKDGILGINLQIGEMFKPVDSFKSLMKMSNDYIVRNTILMVDGLVKLIIGKVSADNLHGIVAIVKLGGDTIKNNGIFDGILLTALISIDLAIINLLPIPALDGGHIMFIIIEKIIGRPLNEEVIENISKIFFLLLLGLMVVIIVNDVFALIMKKF